MPQPQDHRPAPSWETVPEHIMATVFQVGRRGYEDVGRGCVLLHRQLAPDQAEWTTMYTERAAVARTLTEPWQKSAAASLARNTARYDPRTQVAVFFIDDQTPHSSRTAVLIMPDQEGSREDAAPLAREIVSVGPTPEGCFVLTTFSQRQIDELLAQPGGCGWAFDAARAELTLGRIEEHGLRPLATFSLSQRTHRRALRDALAGGTIHLCAAESVDTQTNMIDGGKLALDLAPNDRTAIEMALKRPH